MMKRNIKRITILLTVVIAIAFNLLYANCDFMAIMVTTETIIPDIVDPNGDGDCEDYGDPGCDYDDPGDYFDYLRHRSTSSLQNDGYGIVYYDDYGSFVDSYYLTCTNCWYADGDDDTAPYVLDEAEDAIMDEDNNAVIVLGHDRNGTGGYGSHPFTFEWNNTTYSFMHNGDCSSFKDDFYNELVNWDSDWFTTHPSNWGATSYSQFIDSELLFHFIMSRVISYGGDVVAGIMSALNEQDVDPDQNGDGADLQYEILNTTNFRINFVLSDGEALYVFRNTPSADASYNIEYITYNNGLIALKTQEDIPDPNVEEIDQFSLVTFERNGQVTEYSNFNVQYDITVTNEYDNTNIGGYFRDKRNVAQNWCTMDNSSGQSVGVIPGESWDFRTVRGVIDYSSTDRKFKRWEEEDDKYFLIYPDHSFSAATELEAEFSDIFTANFSVPSAIGTIEIKDHWYLIENEDEDENEAQPQWHEIPSSGSFHPYEVFKNVTIETQKYEIKVDDFHVDGSTAYFFNEWTGIGFNVDDSTEPQTKIVFTGTLIFPTATYNTIPDDPVGASSAPTNLTVDGSSGNPVLTWDHVNDNDRSHYNIWANYIPLFGGSPTGWFLKDTASENSWTDTNVNTGGATYDKVYYKVTVEDYFENVSGYSNTVQYRGDVIYYPAKETDFANDVPAQLLLYSSYPNPFNPVTNIRFDLPEGSKVTLKVYDINGRVATVLMNGVINAGYYSVTWDATEFNSGIYFINFMMPGYTRTEKVMLLK